MIDQAANVFRGTRCERCLLGCLYRVRRGRALNRHVCLRPCRPQISTRCRSVARCRKIELKVTQVEPGNCDGLCFAVVLRLVDKTNQAAGTQLGVVSLCRNGARELHVVHGNRRCAVAVNKTDGTTDIRLGFVFFVINRHADVTRERAAAGKRQLLVRRRLSYKSADEHLAVRFDIHRRLADNVIERKIVAGCTCSGKSTNRHVVSFCVHVDGARDGQVLGATITSRKKTELLMAIDAAVAGVVVADFLCAVPCSVRLSDRERYRMPAAVNGAGKRCIAAHPLARETINTRSREINIVGKSYPHA